jgi:hypothetical protein
MIGYKALIAIFLSNLAVAIVFRNELRGQLAGIETQSRERNVPKWVTFMHLLALAMVVYTSHYPQFFVGFFIFFLGFVSVTREYQENVELREPLLVGFFLAGLVCNPGGSSLCSQALVTYHCS